MKIIVLNIKITEKSILYGIFDQTVSFLHDLYWLIASTVNSKIWKTRCEMVINQCNIPAENVFKLIVNHLKKL